MTERIGAVARIREDLAAAKLRDPAARGGLEIALLYPGLHAVWAYRLWHALWVRRIRFVARLGSQVTRWLTGIEIHPGATIGDGVAVGAGAKVLGPITIGAGSVIGANAVVTRDAPADSILVGVPAKPRVKREGLDTRALLTVPEYSI